jgi:hypothetical protein
MDIPILGGECGMSSGGIRDNNFNFLRLYAAIGVLVGYDIVGNKPFFHLGVFLWKCFVVGIYCAVMLPR